MYEQLRLATEEYPEDHDRKLILADYLEETGDIKEAEFWRWMYKHKLLPYKHTEPLKYPYTWVNLNPSTKTLVPFEVRNHMYPEWYLDQTEAVDALMSAYYKWQQPNKRLTNQKFTKILCFIAYLTTFMFFSRLSGH